MRNLFSYSYALRHISKGFTLLELLVVLSVITLTLSMVGLSTWRIQRTPVMEEAQRLVAHAEQARATARSAGQEARLEITATGYRIRLASQTQNHTWKSPLRAPQGQQWILGPEPVLPAQSMRLESPQEAVLIFSDGILPFALRKVDITSP